MILNSILSSKSFSLTKLTDENTCELCGYYKKSPYLLADYSIGLKSMWQPILQPEFTVIHGCLLVMCTIKGEAAFDFPLPLDERADIRSAIIAAGHYCREHFIPFRFRNVPEECLSQLTSLYPRCDITYHRNQSDYLYEVSSLRDMTGRIYSAQRNHIKRFHTRYPGAVFTVFERDDIPHIRHFLSRFRTVFNKDTESSDTELALAEKMIARVGSSCYLAGGYVLNNEILSFCLSEICGNVLIDHIEKALPEYEGIYPATVQTFLQRFGTVQYFNREDDAADRGLRMSKLQYHPCRIAKKISVHIKNELSLLNEVPTLASERLTFDALTESDVDAYDTLSLDIERNHYWGYDYREHCKLPSRGYFYRDQRSDFQKRLSLCFAIRYEGVMIGEAILYNFDCQGNAEIGIRLFPAFEGHGYGRESLKRVCSFALYHLGLEHVIAKCYKENRSSSRMLSSVMRPNGEDDVFEYYLSTF